MTSGTRSNHPGTYPVIITADGSAWCTTCGWLPPDDSVRDPFLLRLWSLEHVDTSPPCLAARQARGAAIARHPSTYRRRHG